MKGVYKTSVGPLVSSPERRKLAAPQMNRLATSSEPIDNRIFCSSIGFPQTNWYVPPVKRSRTFFYALETIEGTENGCLVEKTTGRGPVLPRPRSLPRCAPPRP